MSTTDTLEELVEAHPRLLGFLFAAMVLVSQTGTVAAGMMEGGVGP